MGFYLRKALKVGLFRFNLSKSGIGISAGIPGLRLGMGPRGTYIHAGRGGLYFRKTLGGRSSVSSPGSAPPLPFEPRSTVAPLEDIDSGSVFQMTDSSSSDFLAELDEKRKRGRLMPWVLVTGVIGVVAAVGLKLGVAATIGLKLGVVAAVGLKQPLWLPAVIGGLTLVTAWYAHQRDQVRRTTVVFYELDADLEGPYDALHAAFGSLQRCGGLWLVEARADVLDGKYNAGAAKVVKRSNVLVRFGEPPLLKTNILVPILPAGRQTLAFLPDRVVVFDPAGIGAVSYRDLRVAPGETQFIEDGTPPQDGEIVGKTWRYVNKKGGPDRRFSHNPELPILRYGQLSLQSGSGLNEMFHASRVEPFQALAAALQRMADAAAASS